MTAPAPTQSSKAGRSEPSSHRSPAGITATRGPYFAAAVATARQFLKQAVRVGVAPVAKLSAEPLGEGSASRAPAGMLINEAGESEYAEPPRRTPASSASTDAAKAAADSSFQRQGKTTAPLELAISTQVENESTSTMITTSEPAARCRIPFSPHSHLTSKPDWSNVMRIALPAIPAIRKRASRSPARRARSSKRA